MSRAFKNRQKSLKRSGQWRSHQNELSTPRSGVEKAKRALWKANASTS